ncbi:MAG: ferredoxin:glutaredoxin reductase [Candidatus Bathyarchaeota archaeon]|nr:ferredoxin:glutaredoxin reductase [Candidatus Bathyarchaeum sp.]
MTSLEQVRERAENDAKTYGYYLTPDKELLQDLLEGLQKNEIRYGYPSCPCRLASGKIEYDRDIICPCDYRDPDIEEHGFCYCALYVRKDVRDGKKPIKPIPERRPKEKQMNAYKDSPETKTQENTIESNPSTPKMKLYYCRQCGYVCFREEPPYICPICKAKKEMFAEVTAPT